MCSTKAKYDRPTPDITQPVRFATPISFMPQEPPFRGYVHGAVAYKRCEPYVAANATTYGFSAAASLMMVSRLHKGCR